MTSIEILKSLASWGPGALIAGLMILAFYRLAKGVLVKFVEAQQEQAKALGRQAQSMEGLRDALTVFVTRDNSEHREMLILLKVIASGVDVTAGDLKQLGDVTAGNLKELGDRVSALEARKNEN